MPRDHDFSRRSRGRHTPGHRGRPKPLGPLDDTEDWPLTKAEIRELERRLTDTRDRTRYLLASNFGSRFALYYNVSGDMYGMNNPRYATLFKRRAAALAIKRLLGSGIQVLRCRVDHRDRLVPRSVPKPRARGNRS
jgi:hypothetical protein